MSESKENSASTASAASLTSSEKKKFAEQLLLLRQQQEEQYLRLSKVGFNKGIQISFHFLGLLNLPQFFFSELVINKSTLISFHINKMF